MENSRRTLFFFAETSIHAGTGAQVGAVDLPIQRERHTGYPVIHGSGIKGALRGLARDAWGVDVDEKGRETGDEVDVLHAVFGPDTSNAQEHAGALAVGDARLVALPVQAPGRLFAWATCPGIVARLRRDVSDEIQEVSIPQGKEALVAGGPTPLILEEFAYDSDVRQEVKKLGEWLSEKALPTDPAYKYWKEKMKSDLVVLADAEFQDLCQAAMEIVTRVKLDPKTKTVETGALWTEEAMPADTLLASVIVGQRPAAKAKKETGLATGQNILDKVAELPARLQVGGDETTGRGWVSLRWYANGGGEQR